METDPEKKKPKTNKQWNPSKSGCYFAFDLQYD